MARPVPYTPIAGVGEFVQTRALGQDGHTLFTHFPVGLQLAWSAVS